MGCQAKASPAVGSPRQPNRRVVCVCSWEMLQSIDDGRYRQALRNAWPCLAVLSSGGKGDAMEEDVRFGKMGAVLDTMGSLKP